MKITVILCGEQSLVQQQAEELSFYLRFYFPTQQQVTAWLISDNASLIEYLKISAQVKQINFSRVEHKYLAEEYLNALTRLFEMEPTDLLIFGSNEFATGLAVRLACRLKGSSCVHVKKSHFEQENLNVEKSVYSNNLNAQFRMQKKPYCIALAKGFKTDQLTAFSSTVNQLSEKKMQQYSWLKNICYHSLPIKSDLKNASIIIAVGKGIGNKESIRLADELARNINAQLGATRPVVMNGWLEMDKLIGASGTIAAPDLCIIIAASGAAAFAVGIEKSQLIIAINQDQSAPVFKIADAGIIAPYREIIEELSKLFI